MIEANLPALQVVIPLLSAPLCMLLGKGRPAWLFATLVAWCSFYISISLYQQVQLQGVLNYEHGGWPAPWGIAYRIDELTSFVLLIVSGIAALVMPYALKSVEKEIPAHNQALFYTALLLCLAGLLGIVITGDAFNVFVFLEISSLSAYTLLAQGDDRRSLTSTYQYLVMGTVGGTFILIGVGLLYMITGTLNMMDLAERLQQVENTGVLRAALAFLIVGTGLKLALFPLHLWLPNAYTFAPSVVTAFIAATATKVAVYMLLRFVYTVFGFEFSFQVMPLGQIMMVLGSVAIISASLSAIYQSNIKRMLAYSSVAQIGYITLGIGLANVTGLTAGIVHLFNHALIKAALFMSLGAVMFHKGTVDLAQLKGLGRQMPWTMAAFVLGGLSLIGVPLTVGFISKWYLVLGALENDMWWVAAIILVGSLLAVIYVWRVVETIYFTEKTFDDETATFNEAPLMMLIPTWLLIMANIYFGINTSLTVNTAKQAAGILMGTGGQ